MASTFLRRVRDGAVRHAESRAFLNSRGESLTYGELWGASDALARRICEIGGEGPVAVCGHKSPLMLVAILGALKAGRGYAPIDRSFPEERTRSVVGQLGRPVVVATDPEVPAGTEHRQGIVRRDELEALVRESALGGRTDDPWPEARWLDDGDIFYLLFTSGSTGVPKGVPMLGRNVDAFLEYSDSFFPEPDTGAGDEAGRLVSFCRVPYSFDLSMNDFLSGLASGATLFALEEEAEVNLAAAFEAFRASGMRLWISTPSFVEMCLVDPTFGPGLLPRLSTMILAGEVLRPATAERILERFPAIVLRNMYGPTETNAVSELAVDLAMARSEPLLSVGYVNGDVTILIVDPEDGREMAPGEAGEIWISGPTTTPGYFKRPDLSERAFVERECDDGVVRRFYRTGDKGWLLGDGRLFCDGRYDFQVKLNGVRIELGELERVLCELPYVENAVVLPKARDGKVSHLVAHVLVGRDVLADAFGEVTDREASRRIKAELSRFVPAYMLPRVVRVHDDFPLNTNGKVDRKALG